LPASGTKIAYNANRDGVAARFAAPAVPKTIAVAFALLPDDPWLGDVELAIVQAAPPHDAHPLSRWQTVPGIGQSLRRVRLYAMHDRDRLPTGQEVVSSGRRVKGAKASAGTRLGSSGTNIGNAHRTWAFAEAATLVLRHHPAGQRSLAR